MKLLNKKFLIILIALIIALAGFIIWFYQYKQINNRTEISLYQEQIPESTTTPTLKTYRNEEWGFEFQYPEDWTFEVNGFYSPFSKFNLAGNASAKSYNPFRPHFLLNIVTPDFADRAVISFENLNASTSAVIVGGKEGIKYEYNFEGSVQIGIDFPFGKYRIILGGEKEHADVFNQILTSFKFL